MKPFWSPHLSFPMSSSACIPCLAHLELISCWICLVVLRVHAISFQLPYELLNGKKQLFSLFFATPIGPSSVLCTSGWVTMRGTMAGLSDAKTLSSSITQRKPWGISIKKEIIHPGRGWTASWVHGWVRSTTPRIQLDGGMKGVKGAVGPTMVL